MHHVACDLVTSAHRCLPCSANHYCLEASSEPSSVCPAGPGFDCSSGVLTITPGFWCPPFVLTNLSSEDSGVFDGNSTLLAYKCSSINACVGGSVTETQLVAPNLCGPGYVGDLCSGCKVGWVSTGGGKCVRCNSKGVLIFSLIVVPGVALTLIAVLVAVITHVPRQKAQVRYSRPALFEHS